ncbi:DUF4382 domain-containing protein [Sinomicrobium weinanense]|uniref:DUF4382 domain-containing protein n=1 Tax=Sinomicrobium weinanense TaxID=2842200 RepID=A0A926JQH5_9FLAO|nr:DUF4382 domain-containing protein [Sinomicrobium weinanense]MBC9795620.1 DUF4382 domain-containing protein [Sinomicrobium weinanense]MBU3124641.1 DUF4382 domain-containing protein [Sinomicrobium weinanense]
MKNRVLNLLLPLLLVVFVVSCSDDDDGTDNRPTANAKVYITDAPVDNAGVKGAFVTITDVKVDGVSVENFNAMTIDLMQYQNGDTQLLGDLEVKAGGDANVTLVLDYETDAQGNAPGCYILTDVKHALESGNNEITLDDDVDIIAETTNELVVDFDLRKTIRSSAESEFEFVSGATLENAVRVVNKAETAEINGNVSGRSNADGDVIVVYAYEKGEYSDNEENENSEGIRFAGAVTSALVNDMDEYKLTFLEEGEYELHFASYSRNSITGKAEFQSSLTVESLLDLNILNLKLMSSVNLSVNVRITGTVN